MLPPGRQVVGPERPPPRGRALRRGKPWQAPTPGVRLRPRRYLPRVPRSLPGRSARPPPPFAAIGGQAGAAALSPLSWGLPRPRRGTDAAPSGLGRAVGTARPSRAGGRPGLASPQLGPPSLASPGFRPTRSPDAVGCGPGLAWCQVLCEFSGKRPRFGPGHSVVGRASHILWRYLL